MEFVLADGSAILEELRKSRSQLDRNLGFRTQQADESNSDWKTLTCVWHAETLVVSALAASGIAFKA
jgi:hypothetical protein